MLPGLPRIASLTAGQSQCIFCYFSKFKWSWKFKLYSFAKLRNLQTFVRGRVGGGEQVCPGPPPSGERPYNFPTLRSYIFVSFQQITSKLGNFTNFRALSPLVSTHFSPLFHVKRKKKKTAEGSIPKSFTTIIENKHRAKIKKRRWLKLARYSFSRSIPPKFERKLRRHKQRFGKIDATVVLDKD